MKHPFFSVIIPTFNRCAFLKIAVESALNQSFDDFEIVICDDGSHDNSADMITAFNDRRIRYFRQENKGVSAARNAALKISRGEFIAFLDSDDRFRHDKLKTTHAHIQNNPQYKIFHSQEVWYRAGSYLPQKKSHAKPHGNIFAAAAKICSVSISTAVVHKSVFKENGLFDETMPACEDYDFWLRAANFYEVFLIDEFLTIKEGGRPSQQSHKYPAMDSFRIYALEKAIGSGKLSTENLKIAKDELAVKKDIFDKGAKKRSELSPATADPLFKKARVSNPSPLFAKEGARGRSGI
jgi:glycosyltransferase involved in cell wall biosynthesis